MHRAQEHVPFCFAHSSIFPVSECDCNLSCGYSAGLGRDFDTEVEVAGVVVSGPPIMRTVMHDQVLGTLFQVVFINESIISEWERDVSGGYRAERDPQSWERTQTEGSKEGRGRRSAKKKAQDEEDKESKEASGTRDYNQAQAIESHWYTPWSAYAEEQEQIGIPPVFSADFPKPYSISSHISVTEFSCLADETYLNQSLWDGTVYQNYFRYSKLELSNMSNVIRCGIHTFALLC